MNTRRALSQPRFGLPILAAVTMLCMPMQVRADQVILDDLIVDGSVCAGFDCVNGESFGFDTLRLKENNLRIRFQDTSSSASFPTNDWQLTANDTSNGGANKFSIDDIDGGRTPFTVEAGAPSHSLYVDSSGLIGLRTNNPVVEIHSVAGDTPTLRLEQSASSGFAPQIWDMAGNETNFFIRDVSNGSKLPFRIRPNAPSSSIDIQADGDIGMGTGSPDSSVHVSRTDNAQLRVENTSDVTGDKVMMVLKSAGTPKVRFALTAGSTSWTFDVGSSPDQFAISKLGTGIQEFRLTAAGTGVFQGNSVAVNHVNTSSRELKTDFADVNTSDVLDQLALLPISQWRYKSKADNRIHVGPVAEDFQRIFGLGDGRSISTVDASGVTMAAIQGLAVQLREKEVLIQAQQNQLNEQDKRMVQLEMIVKDLADRQGGELQVGALK